MIFIARNEACLIDKPYYIVIKVSFFEKTILVFEHTGPRGSSLGNREGGT